MCAVAQNAETESASLTNGYRGFAGMNIFSGVSSQPYDRFAITTVHGIQSNNLYMGMGASLQFVTNNNDSYDYRYDYCDDGTYFDFTMPFFFNVNYEMPVGKFVPFADLKIGYALGDVNGLYCCQLPESDCRILACGAVTIFCKTKMCVIIKLI